MKKLNGLYVFSVSSSLASLFLWYLLPWYANCGTISVSQRKMGVLEAEVEFVLCTSFINLYSFYLGKFSFQWWQAPPAQEPPCMNPKAGWKPRGGQRTCKLKLAFINLVRFLCAVDHATSHLLEALCESRLERLPYPWVVFHQSIHFHTLFWHKMSTILHILIAVFVASSENTSRTKHSSCRNKWGHTNVSRQWKGNNNIMKVNN